MNAAYALVCVVLSVKIFNPQTIGAMGGSALLLVEGLLIFILAQFEWRVLQKTQENGTDWKNQV